MSLRYQLSQYLRNALLLALRSLLLGAISEIIVRILFGDSIALTPRYHTSAVYGEVTL